MSEPTTSEYGVYGEPDPELVTVNPLAVQFSPLHPGGQRLEGQGEASLREMIIHCPPGTIERRAALAMSLRALQAGGELLALAPKLLGGNRLQDELEAFGCAVEGQSRRHHKICRVIRPGVLSGIDAAIQAGAMVFRENVQLWTQPGVFSWDKVDRGSQILAANLPRLAGTGADFGCGIGVLEPAILAQDSVRHVTGYDIDRRAIDCAIRNVVDPRVRFENVDVRVGKSLQANLDFIVTNPPFHETGFEKQGLGKAFLAAAHRQLRKGGTLCLVANRHLPYEAIIKPLFREFEIRAQLEGFKVLEARK
ncbi:MAG: methyltransferase [Hyphomicrobiales bacterium]|nr:methyltransferase [Hyphomicrobiales bacterium]MDE2114850.1 class I SAM-dependent methyltransferase [Hyphomicrobiales bacterium]